MNPRVALALVVLLVALGGGALLYNYQERTQKADNTAALGKALLNVKVADVATIKITEPKATLTLKRQGDGWIIAERRNFPADITRVREFGLKLIDLKVGQSEPIGEKDRARLNLDSSGTQVELASADGKPLAKLTVGKKYFKREVENPDKALADGRFVVVNDVAPAQAGAPSVVYIVSDPLAPATTKTSEWIDRTSFQIEKVKTLEVKMPSGDAWRVERTKDDADWKLVGAKPGEKLDVSRANAATYSLSLLELADIAPDDAKDTGLDKPTTITATTLDGLTYDLKVGKLEGDNYYVRFSSSGSLAPSAVVPAQAGTPSPDEERLKKLRER